MIGYGYLAAINKIASMEIDLRKYVFGIRSEVTLNFEVSFDSYSTVVYH